MTFVYYEEQGKPTPEFWNLQLAFIENETKNRLVRVKSKELAEMIKLEPGKFHCYYKPSFVNFNSE